MLVVDAIVASSAAPTYFNSVRSEGFERSYVDGGMWANTPALSAVMEAHTEKKIKFNEMWCLIIGNGDVARGIAKDEYDRLRPSSLGMVNCILDMMFTTQASLVKYCLANLIGEHYLMVLDTTLPRDIKLDDVREACRVLPALGEECAMKHMKDVELF